MLIRQRPRARSIESQPMKSFVIFSICASAAAVAACSDATQPIKPIAEPSVKPTSEIVYRADVKLVTRVEDAKPGVFVPPFENCQDPLAGDPAGKGKDGKVCANVAISGATEAGKSFSKYASCEVVRTQRPYYPTPPAKVPSSTDPRLNDAAYMAEVNWAKGELQASGCVCCHDSTILPKGSSQWDISSAGVWLDTISDTGLGFFAGYADSSVLGAYPAADNHNFDRAVTGVPSTDPARMKKLITAELAQRGISVEKASSASPFGGPIYVNSIRPPTACTAGEGVLPDGTIAFKGGNARYVYMLEVGSKNPGVPPNLDRPMGTRWRLDVLPSADALASGLAYGKTPGGSYQDTPVSTPALTLEKGTQYVLHVLKDVGLPLANCVFTFGETPAMVDAGMQAMDAAPSVDAANGDAGVSDGGASPFGAACMEDAGCSAPTTYCAKQPGSQTGYCTVTGCKQNARVCPSGWGCFDLSMFQPGAPSICTKP
jgi:hypothetical protein